MPSIPFVGRLHVTEYLALSASFVLLFLETIVRSITLLLPTPIIRFFYRISRNAFNSLSSPYSRRARNKKKSVTSPIAQASDFVELCELYEYSAEEHVVQTQDGYLLGVHRLGWRKGEEDQRVNSGPDSVQKKVVYLHHGLLMNSEVWVCLTEKERCLPFVLVDMGYDVWLGNNRGNKYSKKCLHYAPTEIPFWNFSMDQFAFHDIPDTIDYILSTTQQRSLSYIGFSQGTAQAFATLSIHPTLNSKVDCFIALAPAMAPPGLASGIVASLCKSNPEVLFLAFGRRAILGSSTMWQALLYPAIFVWFIDKSLNFLFSWKTQNIAPHQKLAAYPHLYSFTSTKSVVHWFQIIRNGKFQMYDDEVTTPLAVGNGSKYYKVAKFPTRNIKTPIVLVYGGSDSLVDIKLMLKELPKHTVAKEIKKYEHLDLLWASDVDKLVFPHVLEALENYAVPEKTKRTALGWRGVQRGIVERASMTSPNGSLPPYRTDGSDDDAIRNPLRAARMREGIIPNEAFTFDFDGTDNVGEYRPSTAEEHMDESDMEEEYDGNESLPEHLALTPRRFVADASAPTPGSGSAAARAGKGDSMRIRTPARTDVLSPQQSPSIFHAPSEAGSDRTVVQPKRRILSPRSRGQEAQTPGSLEALSRSEETRPSLATIRPEGWWSSTNSEPTSKEPSPNASRVPLQQSVQGEGKDMLSGEPGDVTTRQQRNNTRQHEGGHVGRDESV